MRTVSRFGMAAVLVGLAVLAAGCGGGSAAADNRFAGAPLTGAGATFPAPVYDLWFKTFVRVEPGARINYQAIGSGGGIEQLLKKTVDFGASDAPLQEDEVKAFADQGREIVQFPTVLGGVAVAYNLKEVPRPLQLDGAAVAGIFLGTVRAWNDPAIAALNPGVSLPNLPIQVCHRADESGTTFVFTSWLARESQQWESRVGAGKAVQWPVGNGGNGNDGVAACVAQADGAVGYVEYQYAVTGGLAVARIRGKDGSEFVAPSVASISAAAGSLSLPATPTTNVLDSDAPGAYPIASTTYLLVPKDLTPLGKAKAQTLVDFLRWALTRGQGLVQSLNYAPLPAAVARADLRQLDELRFEGTRLAPSAAVAG